jgi:CHAT domain-containing protein/tetratricopeptide (TPR) repeat protein
MNAQCCLRLGAGVVCLAAALAVGGARAATPGDLAEFQKLLPEFIAHYQAHRFDQAEPLARRLVSLTERSGTPDAQATALCYLANTLTEMARYDEAEPLYQQALAKAEKMPGGGEAALSGIRNSLGALCYHQGKLAEAEPHYRAAVELREKTMGRDHPSVGPLLNNLGTLYKSLGRYAEARPPLLRALQISERTAPPDPFDIALSLNNLAALYRVEGRYAEAEALYKRAMTALEKQPRRDHPYVAYTLDNLATLCRHQNRDEEALRLYERAGQILDRSLPPGHPERATNLNNLGSTYLALNRYDEAERAYRQAQALVAKSRGVEHPHYALAVDNLGGLYDEQGRYDLAEPLYREALQIFEKALGPEHPEVATNLHNLGSLLMSQGKCTEALAPIERAIAIRDRLLVNPGHRAASYNLRARIRWELGQRAAAVADLRQAMELLEQQRGLAAGGERERARYFARFAGAFERMVEWQTVLGDVAEAFAAIERGRARGLLDQIETHGVDLLAGLPDDQAAALRRRETDAQSRLASLEKQLQMLDRRKELSADERARQAGALRTQVHQARADYLGVYADLRNASPAYRLAVGCDRKPAELAAVQRWLAERDGLLLEYLLGNEGGYVVVVPPAGPPRLEKLSLGDDAARRLGVEPGPLTAQRLSEALRTEGGTGVLQLLKRSARPAQAKLATAKLAALWESLIPAAERTALCAGKLQRLLVAADSAMAGLPFEALVVEPGESPRYLLDVGPPTVYAPSASVLLNLAERRAAEAAARDPVLTVGDPRYPQPAAADRAAAELTAQSRYVSVGGSLAELPFTKWETAWVAEVFRKQGTGVLTLAGGEATEAAVRRQSPGRKLLHLACHGLVDQGYGNLFGALALTPGRDPADPADDGFLTLAETYPLNLRGCELAILSACDTNDGPQQRGEGAWALSRGFLVAGARRVVASNWLVDDRAAASLVSYYCGGLAGAEKTGQPPDYAAALRDAKRWVRQQEQWTSPFYWGPFVLIGPN